MMIRTVSVCLALFFALTLSFSFAFAAGGAEDAAESEVSVKDLEGKTIELRLAQHILHGAPLHQAFNISLDISHQGFIHGLIPAQDKLMSRHS